jgi:hypothetical protein
VYRAVPSVMRRSVLMTMAAVLSLTLAACGDGQVESTLDERAQWSPLALPDTTQLGGERVSFSASTGRSGDLPWLVAGVAAEAGQPDRARVWTETDEGWRWDDLPQPADRDATVSLVAADGSNTWVAGWTWAAGDPIQPLVVESTDRRSWKVVELPDEAAERAFQPGAAAKSGDRLLVVGRDADQQPVLLILAGDDGKLVDLPAVPEGREFDGFTGIAAAGDTLVAVASAEEPGKTGEPMVYRSTDGGDTWSVTPGPVTQPAHPSGVAVLNGAFVATGYQYDAAGTAVAAAWSSPDGASWTAEVLPALDEDRDGFAPGEGEDFWLGAPSAGADRVVAPIATDTGLRYGVVSRDAAGTWSIVGSTNAWKIPGSPGDAALGDDGSVFLAQSGHNTGRLGELTPEGRWRAIDSALGTQDAGVRWTEFLDPTAAPVLVGWKRVYETFGNGGWSSSNQLTRVALDGDALVDSPWDPAESQQLLNLVSASTPEGATVALGAQVMDGEDGTQKRNVVGWFRASAGAGWTPVQGLSSPGGDWVSQVALLNGTWVAVGEHMDAWKHGVPAVAAVWTSVDGVNWSRAEGPFPGGNGDTEASGACVLPGGDVLAVGSAEDGAQTRPVAWRGSAGKWQRVDPAAFDAEFGSFSSCTTLGETTIVQGTRAGRDTVWRTTDGVGFAPSALGARWDSFGTVRVVDGGFAAAGSRHSDGHRGAVVWLSKDARTWRAVAVPSARSLTGADVMPDGSGGLVVAANSGSSPEVWKLANPEDLFEEG